MSQCCNSATLRSIDLSNVKLSLKIAAAMMLLVASTLLVFGMVTVRRETALLEADIARDALLVAEGIAAVAEQVPLSDGAVGERRNLSLLDRDAGEVRVRWLDVPGARVDQLPQLLRDGLSGGRATVIRDLDGFRAVAPVQRGGQLVGAIEVFETTATADSYRTRTLATNGLVVLLVLLSSAGLAVVLGRALVGQPIQALIRRARKVSDSDPEAPQRNKEGDEIAMLAAEIEMMASELEARQRRVVEESARRVEAEQQLRHADRLTTVGQLAAGMAHELGTPLNVISGRARLIERAASPDGRVAADARTVWEQADRIKRIVERMLHFSRRSPPARVDCDVTRMVRDAVRLLREMASTADVELCVHLPDEPETKMIVDPDQLRQVVTNLVLNGIQALPRGGRVDVRMCIEDGGQGCFRLEVSDTGPGIPPDLLPQLFDPFFTTKEPGEGTGLGLSLVHGIVRDHGGTVSVDSVEGQGTTFTVRLPQRHDA